ncbi:serine protease snake-like [Anopheles ziemanni]|uniref:serine protease snake-like n=1 Tax=Anopheles coustani TaxID=139045 RepID=UPI0026594D82|nr:serine protease snake-like [Anopheles coustani]XP_058169278.1 serine protease snake-like [Anopheles ziemanni]
MVTKGVAVFSAIVLGCFLCGVQGVRVAEQKCQEYIKTIASLNPVPVDRTNEFVTQINGVPAKEAEFPHQVRLGQWFYEDYDDPSFIVRCSGALISENYVLVSGHCVWAMGDKYVSLGRHDYTKNSSLPEVQIQHGKNNFIEHPNFKLQSAYDDIGLYLLTEPVNFTSHIYPACLWTDESPLQLNKFTATSFTLGKLENDTDDTHVAKLLVNVIPNAECDAVYVNSTYFDDGLTDNHLCVESPVEWKSACQGDMGGLLQTLEKDSKTVYRLYGVETCGNDCTENPLKFSYTKVQKYLDWIEEIVWGA